MMEQALRRLQENQGKTMHDDTNILIANMLEQNMCVTIFWREA